MSAVEAFHHPQHVELRVVELKGSRISLVTVLSIGAFLTGTFLAFTGQAVVPLVPAFGLLPGWPWLYGGTLALAGAALYISLKRGGHGLALIAASVAMLMYFILIAGFVVLWVNWLTAPESPLTPPYPAAAYATLASGHAVHAHVEWLAWRRERSINRRSRLRGY